MVNRTKSCRERTYISFKTESYNIQGTGSSFTKFTNSDRD